MIILTLLERDWLIKAQDSKVAADSLFGKVKGHKV
jgi:hypothetical protein